ncbi:CGNR zinc finger domain-containing protein [Pseudonocardia sp.]|uniref:CGNR zinc finger domain-containing protein n=1 Tax=Pseudonocardia sp. TaxID=60912 RepID=UPI003D0E9251
MPRIDELTPGERRRFRTGRPCLDFTHTGGEGEHATWEILHAGEDVGRWVAVVLDLPADLPATDVDLAPAKALRNAIGRVARGLAAGEPPRPADAAVVNDAAARPPLVPRWQLGPDPTTPDRLDRHAPAGGSPVAAALSTLARDAVDLFTGPLARRIRTCSAVDCGLLFVDASRPGTRRWCSMQRCGNLAKVRRHRGHRGHRATVENDVVLINKASGTA